MVGMEMKIFVFKMMKYIKRKLKSKSVSATKLQGFILICEAAMSRKFNIR